MKALQQRLFSLATPCDTQDDDTNVFSEDVGDEEDALMRSLCVALGLSLQRLLWQDTEASRTQAETLLVSLCRAYALPLNNSEGRVSDVHVTQVSSVGVMTRVARVYLATHCVMKLHDPSGGSVVDNLQKGLTMWLGHALSAEALGDATQTPSVTLKVALVRYVFNVSFRHLFSIVF